MKKVKLEKIGGENFPANLHADEGLPLNQVNPDSKTMNYGENPDDVLEYQANRVDTQLDVNEEDRDDQQVRDKITKSDFKDIDEFMQHITDFLNQNK